MVNQVHLGTKGQNFELITTKSITMPNTNKSFCFCRKKTTEDDAGSSQPKKKKKTPTTKQKTPIKKKQRRAAANPAPTVVPSIRKLVLEGHGN